MFSLLPPASQFSLLTARFREHTHEPPSALHDRQVSSRTAPPSLQIPLPVGAFSHVNRPRAIILTAQRPCPPPGSTPGLPSVSSTPTTRCVGVLWFVHAADGKSGYPRATAVRSLRAASTPLLRMHRARAPSDGPALLRRYSVRVPGISHVTTPVLTHPRTTTAEPPAQRRSAPAHLQGLAHTQWCERSGGLP